MADAKKTKVRYFEGRPKEDLGDGAKALSKEYVSCKFVMASWGYGIAGYALLKVLLNSRRLRKKGLL